MNYSLRQTRFGPVGGSSVGGSSDCHNQALPCYTNTQVPLNHSSLKCMYVNARSIMNKLDELQAVLFEEQPDILGITESWTHDGILDAELS